MVLKLWQDPGDENESSRVIAATLLLEDASADVGTTERFTVLEPLIPLEKVWNQTLRGRYTFLMEGLAGQGFGTFTVGSDFQARGVGVLANGRRFSFSMPIVADKEYLLNGTVMVVRLGAGRVRMWGRIRLNAFGVEGAGLVDGTLRMARPANPGSRFLPDGYNAELSVRGARYFVPKGMPMFKQLDAPAEEAGRAGITLSGEGLPDSVSAFLEFSKTGKVTIGRPNPSNLKLKVSSRTGFFSGDFKVNEPVPGREDRFVRRSVRFSGVMVPQLRTGGGFFHYSPLPNRFAEPPTTSNTTPVYLGGVTIE